MKRQQDQFAGMFSAIGSTVRLRIMRLLIQASPEGLSVGTIQSKVRIPGSTLSHHLDRLKRQDLVVVHRSGTVLRYAANAKSLNQLAGFFLSECCQSPAEVDLMHVPPPVEPCSRVGQVV